MDLLEEYDLINPLGSPNKLFLKFLKSKDLEIKNDEITPDLVEEFENSIDSINLRELKKEKQKELIFSQRRVWINVLDEERLIGSDLILYSDSIEIELTHDKIFYSQMDYIEIDEGSWSKKRFIIHLKDDEIVFEINEASAVPLKEIIEANISHAKHDEIDDLLDLYELYGEGKISAEELEIRKAVIYSDDRYCTSCGEKLDSDSVFCPNCGHEVSD